MKLKYLFSTVLASAVLFGGCVKNDPVGSFDNIQLDKTYLSISDKGGTAELTVTATENWQFVINETWPDVVEFAKDEAGKTYKAKYDEFGNLTNPESEIESKTPSWLKATVLKGEAGETKITFSAEETSGGRELEIALYAGNNKQFLRVRQGSMEAQTATCAEVAAAPDGKTFRLKGVCTSIENFEYGNWYIKDATGEMYIYGTLDSKGATKNFKSIGLEVGDEVEIEGPKGSYKGTPQLVNVSVRKLTKSLLKVTTPSVELKKDATELQVKVAYKGNGVFPAVAESCADWVTYSGMDYIAGVPSKLEPNPCDTALVKFSIASYEEKKAPRTGEIVFSSHSGASKSEVTYTFTQQGIVPDPSSIADAAKAGGWVTVEGTVTAADCSKGFIVTDKSASLFIYTNDKHSYKNGYVVKVVGNMDDYNKGFQIGSPILLKSDAQKVNDGAAKELNATDIDAIIAREDNFTAERVSVTGTASLDKYGNIVIAVSGTEAEVASYYSTMKFDEFDGKQVTVTGYVTSRKTARPDKNQKAQVVILVQEVKAK